MILVIAGSHAQYLAWLERVGTVTEPTKYTRTPEDYCGYANCSYVLVGEYRKNPVFNTPDFEHYARARNIQHLCQYSDAPCVSGSPA